jgi:hypothetical protein
MVSSDAEWIEELRGQTCLQFARTTPANRVPTLLRRIAADLDKLPSHVLVGLTVEVSYVLDEATATVFFDLNEDD